MAHAKIGICCAAALSMTVLKHPRLLRLARDFGSQPISWVLILALMHGALYAAVVPPWQAPDENIHYEYLRAVWNTPNLFPQHVERTVEVNRQVIESALTFKWGEYVKLPTPTHFPMIRADVPYLARAGSLYYRFSFPVYWVVQGWPIVGQLFALRLYSVVLQCLTVWLTFRLAGLIFSGSDPIVRSIPLASAVVVALFPQYTFISASYNDDNLVPLWVAATLYALVKGIRHNGRGRWLTLAILGAGLALLTKRTGASVVLLVGISVPVYGFLWSRSSSLVIRLTGWLVLAALVGVGAVLAFFFIYPPLLPAGLTRLMRLNGDALLQLASYWQDPSRLLQIDWVSALVFLSVSFWGWFGWLRAPLGKTTMEILRRVTLILIVGCGVGGMQAWRARKSEADAAFRLIALLLLGMGLVLSGLIVTAQFLIGPPTYALSGRYLFPFISAFAILAVWGWQAWWPGRWKAQGLLVGLWLLAVVDFIALVLTIVPYFYS